MESTPPNSLNSVLPKLKWSEKCIGSLGLITFLIANVLLLKPFFVANHTLVWFDRNMQFARIEKINEGSISHVSLIRKLTSVYATWLNWIF
jgi:hypothetical protein